MNLLKRKRTKAAEIKDRDEDADQLREAKRQKVGEQINGSLNLMLKIIL